MKQYLELLQDVLDNGKLKGDRTGTGTRAIFGRQMRFDLKKGFPLVTTKKMFMKGVVHELLWMLSGDTNIKYLNDNGVHIWDEWATEYGYLGPIYGEQWRHWAGQFGSEYDQIATLIKGLKEKPNSRRHIVSAWNVADLPDEDFSPQANAKAHKMALAPCHCLFQFFVADNELSCQLYQRSADTFLGLPTNIAFYALLTHMVAQQCDLEVGEFIWTGGDIHLYTNHIAQAKLQLLREPKELPHLVIKRKPASIFEYKYEDFEVVGYDHHPAIKAPISV